MTTLSTDVAVIGAGPNGMALSAHLRAVGIEHVVLGRPFATWRDHMPRGMLLKSEPYGSDVAAPVKGYHLRDYCRATGTAYSERVDPVSLETFVAYAGWYARSLVPEVNQVLVRSLARGEGGFSMSTEDGTDLVARRVVVASGLLPFAYVPAVLRSLPAELGSHTAAHHDLSGFAGRKVAVVGAGQSALELAALLHEAGAQAEVLVKGASVYFHLPMASGRSIWDRARHPASPLCEGWHCCGYYYLPDLFRALPEHQRLAISKSFLGPSGSRWLKPRIEGRVQVITGARVIEATPAGTGVRVIADIAGQRRDATYDHVMAGTGFRVDLERLGYLAPDLRRALALSAGAPVLSRSFESSVPGLYFVGAMAAASLGPSMRFLAGTHFTARRLAGRLKAGRRASAGRQTVGNCVDLSRVASPSL